LGTYWARPRHFVFLPSNVHILKRQTDRKRDREADIHTYRERQIYRETDRHTERQTETDIQRERQTDIQRDRQTETDRQRDRQTDIQRDRQTETDRQTHREQKLIYCVHCFFKNFEHNKYEVYIHTYIHM